MKKQTREEELRKEIENYITLCMGFGYSRKEIEKNLKSVPGLLKFGDEEEAFDITKKQAELKGIKEEQKRILKLVDKCKKCPDCNKNFDKEKCIQIVNLKQKIKEK